MLLFWVDFHIELPIARTTIASLGIVLIVLSFSLMMRFSFPQFLASTTITLYYSLFGQLAQLVSAFFILKALGITAQIIEYPFVFLLSSIVAVLPLTIGGVGARELVFIFSHDYMGIDQNAAVAFSLLFFLITAVTSLLGAFMKFKDNKPLPAEYKEL